MSHPQRHGIWDVLPKQNCSLHLISIQENREWKLYINIGGASQIVTDKSRIELTCELIGRGWVWQPQPIDDSDKNEIIDYFEFQTKGTHGNA